MTNVSDPAARRSSWSLGVEMLTRPYPLSRRVVVPMVTLMLLVPGYLIIGGMNIDRSLNLPALALDRLIPLQPAWTLVYVSHLVFLTVPVLIIRHEEQIRRTFLAYLLVWITGYVCFLVYPTVLPRPGPNVIGQGFFAWCLRLVYSADEPRNNFPSLHVAHACVSALTCWRVHRGVGLAAGVWAALIALSTLFTKQHYVVDVISGLCLAGVAYGVFLRNCPRASLSELDRRAAPVLVWWAIGIHGLLVAGFWVAYLLRA